MTLSSFSGPSVHVDMLLFTISVKPRNMLFIQFRVAMAAVVYPGYHQVRGKVYSGRMWLKACHAANTETDTQSH